MTSMAEHPTPPLLAEASARTLAHYHRTAQAFWEGTRDHDVSQNIDALRRHLAPATAPGRILDLGCGPGRDLLTWRQLGHDVIGLEGAAALADMARAHSGCEVWAQNLLDLTLPPGHFDGIFANAVLFHVPRERLPHTLAALHATLRPGGVLFCSNPRGQDEEGWQGDRYGCWHSLNGWRQFLARAGFQELEHYYRPAGLPREQQPWLATVWRRPHP